MGMRLVLTAWGSFGSAWCFSFTVVHRLSIGTLSPTSLCFRSVFSHILLATLVPGTQGQGHLCSVV